MLVTTAGTEKPQGVRDRQRLALTGRVRQLLSWALGQRRPEILGVLAETGPGWSDLLPVLGTVGKRCLVEGGAGRIHRAQPRQGGHVHGLARLLARAYHRRADWQRWRAQPGVLRLGGAPRLRRLPPC